MKLNTGHVQKVVIGIALILIGYFGSIVFKPAPSKHQFVKDMERIAVDYRKEEPRVSVVLWALIGCVETNQLSELAAICMKFSEQRLGKVSGSQCDPNKMFSKEKSL